MLNGARLVGRGLADTYVNLVYFALMSLLWWLCMLTVVLGPAATLALLTHADPRIGSVMDRPSLAETIAFIGRNVLRGWRLALITFPVLLLLVYNMAYYGTRTSAIGILSPLWLFIFVIGLIITVSAYSIMAQLDEQSAVRAAKLATILTGARLGHALVMIVIILAVGILFAILIVPFILFYPATFAATINRFVLTGLRVAIPDPHSPTPERLAEGQKRRKWFGP